MAPQPANGGIATCPRNRSDIFNKLLGTAKLRANADHPSYKASVRHGPIPLINPCVQKKEIIGYSAMLCFFPDANWGWVSYPPSCAFAEL